VLWTVYCVAALSIGTDAGPDLPAGSDHQAIVVAQAIAVVGTQSLAASPNFNVSSHHASHDARNVAAHCERWRAKLQGHWCTQEQAAWSPKCEVVVHGSTASYLAAVGAGASRTFGSSLIQFGKDKQVARRAIDFRGDSALGLAAVPHEMTHVILADLLDGRQPPRWADEGMAILADSPEKQMLHERDLALGLAARGAFRLHELLTLDKYPHPSRVPAFYGQSASVAACLAKRGDPARFIEFLRRSIDSGYDKALRDVYQLSNISELESYWHEQRLANRGHHGARLALEDGQKENTDRTDATASYGSAE
jgi:hypothetical protein